MNYAKAECLKPGFHRVANVNTKRLMHDKTIKSIVGKKSTSQSLSMIFFCAYEIQLSEVVAFVFLSLLSVIMGGG